ncbi:MAG: MBL fold metallo-hydrolase [Candidatus Bathyarchaeota archaeon]|nr:MAG: MBL fold metallo-hydrolase [Candidatus Bathyarchaeota archaeon]
MVKLRFMGGTHEVGRNAVLLDTGEANLLLDYGVKIGEKPQFPGHIRARDLDGILVSHAHLDHSGGVPQFYLGEGKPFFATSVTTEVMRVLLRDMIKLSGYWLPFEYIEFEEMLRQRRDLGYGQPVKLKNVEFKLANAGHIPGSAMIELNTGGKRVLYTGDLNTGTTRLVHGAKIPRQRLDAVVIESTYASTDHPDRGELEVSFVEAIKEVLRSEGKVLVPAFAVGRSQEMLSVMNAQKLKARMVIDGMARAVNQIYLGHPDFLRTPKTFVNIVSSTREMTGWRDRRQAVRRSDVIVAPSGMLQGGTAMFYMERLALNERNAVFLVSFQVPGTRGARLLETGFFTIKEMDVEVKAQVRHFDFSSHSGKTGLQAFLRGLKGKPDVYVIHGEPENCEALAQWARDELDLNATAPNEGDEFTV